MRMLPILVCFSLALSPVMVIADDGVIDVAPKISKRAELIFSDDFVTPKLTGKWVPLHGTRWSIEDGTLKGEPSTAEYQQEQIARGNKSHSGRTPSSRLMLPADDCILLMRFKLTGTMSGAHFGFNDGTFKSGTGHVCRFTVTVNKGLALLKDRNVKLDGDADETLATSQFSVVRDRWYWMMLEVLGGEMAAQVSGSPVLRAQHSRIDQPKDQVNLPTRGGGTIFYDHVRIWRAIPLSENN